MRVRYDKLVSSADMGTSGTLTYNIDYSDIISRLLLKFNATNSGPGNKNNPIERNITTIELVDGSTVLWSLPGDVAYALHRAQTGGFGKEQYSAAGTGTQSVVIPIEFGRYPLDAQLAFNPNAFRNPQLKVTFDEATVRAAGATGFNTDTFTFTAIVELVEDAPIPEAYLMAKLIADYTSLDTGDTQIDMPRDYPWRYLILRVFESAVHWETNVTNVKLNCDGGKFIPIDLSLSELEAFIGEQFPLCDKMIYTVTQNDEYHEGWMATGVMVSAFHHSGVAIAQGGSYYNGRFRFITKNYEGTNVNAQTVHSYVRGRYPHNTMLIPFGRFNEISEWFNAPSHNNIKLYLTNGDAGAEINVAVQQYRRY